MVNVPGTVMSGKVLNAYFSYFYSVYDFIRMIVRTLQEHDITHKIHGIPPYLAFMCRKVLVKNLKNTNSCGV
jgi:hypothetical protein